jgi:Fe-S cluster assembly protein SufD
MLENFKFNSNEIDKIKNITSEEKDFRLKNLNYFNENGFPNKRNEDWKFSDLREIVSKNFNELNFKTTNSTDNRINFIKDFDHNFIVIINGELSSSNFKFEDKSKIKVDSFLNDNFSCKKELNPLVNLNHALANKGYSLKIDDNYKFKKVLVIYNLFTNDLNENILNSRNDIVVGKNSELHTIEFSINKSKKNFFNNVYENTILKESAVLKSICVQNEKNQGYFHKFAKNRLFSKSNFSSFLFPSGLKFNKLDLEFYLEGEKSECSLQAASFLDQNDHQEIKTRINHLAPNCKSYQRVKNVLNSESKGVYQGKIFVKDVAQKTDAYQLSKAILLSDSSEFDSKPELEIYADDVKCSHGSTSGSLEEDSIYYLMTRGLSRQESVKLLVNGFLNEVIDAIKSTSLKKFILDKLKDQIYENNKH